MAGVIAGAADSGDGTLLLFEGLRLCSRSSSMIANLLMEMKEVWGKGRRCPAGGKA